MTKVKNKQSKCECEKLCVDHCPRCLSFLFSFYGQEVEDIHSALSFFIDKYPSAGSASTKRSMKRIVKKILRMTSCDIKQNKIVDQNAGNSGDNAQGSGHDCTPSV